MKRLTTISTILLLIWANSVSTYSQTPYDPCGEIRVRLSKVDELIVDEKYNQALDILDKIKKNPEMSDCDNMKVVDYKINYIHTLNNELINDFGCPDDNHPHAIDLGLPSGTKWACCNVGANKPEEYGDYYAWGETIKKKHYDWNTYVHCDGTMETCHNLGCDIAGTQYDVAFTNWHSEWQMPSKEQIEELCYNCTYLWTTMKGVRGGCLTSKLNGKNIFLPAAGHTFFDIDNITENSGSYWSSTYDPRYSYNAYHLYFYSNGCQWGSEIDRRNGRSVRPVRK